MNELSIAQEVLGMKPKKLLLIFNPKAGKAEFASMLFEVVDRFTKAGFEVTAYPTQAEKDAYNMVLRRAGGFELICCSGGDGTLNEVIGALMKLEKKPPLGYIPSGTTNDFATSMKIPKNILEATAAVVAGNAYPIDVGCFGGDYFAYVAAFGLFTDVTYDTPQTSKNILGHAAYVLEGVKRLGSIQNYKCKISLDDETFSGSFIFGMASNSTSIGGFKMPMENTVSLDDGLFETVLVKRPKNFVDLQNIAASMMNGEIYTESLIVRKASRLRVESNTPIDWTLDGEFGGSTTDVVIENKRRAIEIMIPKPEITVG